VSIESGFLKTPQLYNLNEDIGERNNLAETYPDIVKEMSLLLEAIKKKTSR